MKCIGWKIRLHVLIFIAALLAGTPCAQADPVIDANLKTTEVISKIPLTPIAVRAMAIVQVSVFEAVNGITGRYPAYPVKVEAAPGASVEAAVAAAVHEALLKLVPTQEVAIEANYQTALGALPTGASTADGLALGERAAATVLALRADDGMAAPDEYRPHASPGVYVPTTLPALPHWGKRKPWAMTSGDSFRPGPPPDLTSNIWTREYNEIKAIGAKTSTQRTLEQTAIARFWETTSPSVYWPIVRCVASASLSDVTDRARLLAVAGIAMDDAVIAVFDAKYAYNFWRPITAIRNGDLDGNDATERDPGWMPFIDTPMHPEYPCAHCIVSGALGAVLEAEIGDGPVPALTTTSSTAPDAPRTWTRVDDFVREVAEARIYDGVHYRNSTEVGTAMGRQIGELAVRSFPAAIR